MSADVQGVTCEVVRPLLPELAEGMPHEAGAAEVHIASCPGCTAELARYRVLLGALADLREVSVEPSPVLLERLVAEGVDLRPPRRLHRVANAASTHRVALSVGGAVVGVTAVGLLWWRTSRRGIVTRRPA